MTVDILYIMINLYIVSKKTKSEILLTLKKKAKR